MPATPESGPRPPYLRTAASPRMLVLLVLLLAAAAVCARLGVWQLDRAEIRGAAEQQSHVSTSAVPLTDVLAPQTGMSGDLVGRLVAVRGTFDDGDLLVPDRMLDGRRGVLVLSPLRVAAADGDAVLPVVRGWVPDVAAAAALDPAPAGEVDVTGYLRGSEQAAPEELPDGQVGSVSTAELVNRWGGPMYSAYLALETVDPAQDPALTPLPAPSGEGGGLNLQNLAYALQWWLFGGFAVLLWGRLVRDEARAAVEEDEPRAADAEGELRAAVAEGPSASLSPGPTSTGADATP